MAFYHRAMAYIALKEFDKALTDIEQVILLKPYWRKVRDVFFFLKKIKLKKLFLEFFSGLLLS
jgi:hypothetical protein